MFFPDESEPLADDELLYRRIPAALNLYDPHAKPHLLPDAFRPNQNDERPPTQWRLLFPLFGFRLFFPFGALDDSAA